MLSDALYLNVNMLVTNSDFALECFELKTEYDPKIVGKLYDYRNCINGFLK